MLTRDVNDRNTLERFIYRQGQTLLSRDLRDQTVIDAQLRWWHNRAIHNAFGVAKGLRVDAVFDTAKDWRIRVHPGVAYDVFGRELVLSRTRELALPTSLESQTLLARYPTAPKASDLGGVCAPSEVHGHLSEPELFWQPTARVSLRDGVPLARTPAETSIKLDTLPVGVTLPEPPSGRVRFDPGTRQLVSRGVMSTSDRDALNALSSDESFRCSIEELCQVSPLERQVPVLARPLARPKIVSGSTIAGSTSWVPWQPFQVDARDREGTPMFGYQVDIDTSAAGFSTVPCYFAWLGGETQSGHGGHRLSLAFPHIEADSTTGFRFVLFVPPYSATFDAAGKRVMSSPSTDRFSVVARVRALTVNWMAIEPSGPNVVAPPLPERINVS